MDSFAGEMRRYVSPGGSIARIAHAALSIAYVGGLLGILVQLRIVMPPTQTGGVAGLFPLVSMIAAVKLSDTCQYIVGRSVGRHKLAPLISPGKTWEGAVGGILLASLIAAYGMAALRDGGGSFNATYYLIAWLYCLSISVAGLMGDLSESLLKRDAGVKDSSDWLPGFGGVLDLLDSILFAGPVAYIWWTTGLLEYHR
jgi:phosphatidate cytidylyltransferase